jgi:hypothetical protein
MQRVDEPEGWADDYRRRALRAAGASLTAVVVGSVLVPVSEGIGSSIVILGVLGLGLGLVGLTRTVRLRRLVERHGWRRREARFRVVGGGNGQPGLVLLPSKDEPEAVLSVSTTVFRRGALAGHEWLWLTGDPLSRFAAVSTPDRDTAIITKRPMIGLWRQRLRRIALGT